MLLGAHMSISGGIHRAFARGEQVGIQTMQIFSKSERQWQARPLSDTEIAQYHAEQARTGIRPVIAHGSYLINLASPDAELWQKSIEAFAIELERCQALAIPFLVTHPGAHTGSGETAGLTRIAEALNRLFDQGVGGATMVLLETTAGQGTSLGYRFEHLGWLLEHVIRSTRLGVCIDTCHLFAAGYELRSAEDYQTTMAEFERIVGIERVHCLHLNDSKAAFASRVDRHTHIGQGAIGLEGFRCLMNDMRFAGRPMIIETPKGDNMAEDIENLRVLRSLQTSGSQEDVPCARFADSHC